MLIYFSSSLKIINANIANIPLIHKIKDHQLIFLKSQIKNFEIFQESLKLQTLIKTNKPI